MTACVPSRPSSIPSQRENAPNFVTWKKRTVCQPGREMHQGGRRKRRAGLGVPQERRTHPLTSERFPWGSARRHVTAVCAGGGATSLQDRPLLCRGLRSPLAERTPSLASRCHLPQRGPGSAGSWWPRHGRARSTLSLRPARSSVVAL